MKQHGFKYLFLTFILTYLSHGALALLSQRGIIQLTDLIGQVLFILGGSSPTIMAFVVVHRYYSKNERAAFYQRLMNFKQPVRYYLFALLIPVVLGWIFILVALAFGNSLIGQVQSFLQYLFYFIPAILFGGLEEVGWRGILQERFKQRIQPLGLAVVIGLIWSLWHLPMFFVPDLNHSNYAVIPFFLQGIVFSLFLTYFYAKTKSIPLVVLLHTSINAAASI